MKNKAVHKGNGLLPYPVIVSASQGDILAMNVVLCHYEPYIARLSMRTSIDEYGNLLWSSVFVTLVAKKYRFMQFELDMVFDTR